MKANIAHWTFYIVLCLQSIVDVFEDALTIWLAVDLNGCINNLTDLQNACMHSITIEASIKYPVQSGQVKN